MDGNRSITCSAEKDMIEEHNKIDAIAIAKDGFVELVIMDAGITEDPEQRFTHFIEKLKAYVYYVIEGDFKKDYPEKTQNEVRFLVMCRLPPTDRMTKLSRLSNPEKPEEGFPIIYRQFSGSDDTPTASPSLQTSKSQSKKNGLVLYAGLALAALTAIAATIGWINVGRNPIPGFVIAAVFASFGLILSKKN